MSALRCTRWTAGHQCGTILRPVVLELGRVAHVCDNCIRFDNGLCRDCPRRREGKALRCATCRQRHKKSHDPVAYARRREHYLAARREKYRTNPEFRQRCIDDAKRRAEAAGRTDIVRAYERHKAEQYRRRRGIKPRKQQQQRTAA